MSNRRLPVKKSFGAKPLVHVMPVWIVGTYDQEGKPNAMTVAYGGICCSQPPSVTVSLRKATYSYGSIMFRKAYTINVPSQAQVAEADYFGTATGRTEDKFAATGMTPVKSDLVDAPYIAEVPLVLECRVIHTLEIGLHTQFIGEIMDVKAEEGVLGADGFPDVKKIQPIVYVPSCQAYYGIGEHLEKAFSIGETLKK
jgi:flavin reductase (DIM6/NTAB) family NADH-FMN oxidoreductase RutF